jgi:hypothetical protein
MFVSAQYDETGDFIIAKTNDDVTVMVPVDEGNRDYKIIKYGDPERETSPLIIKNAK